MLALAGGGTLATAGIGAGSVIFSGNARAQAGISVEDREATTTNGVVQDISASISGNCVYSNVESEVTHIQFLATVNGDTYQDPIWSRDNDYLQERGEVGPHSGDFRFFGELHEPMAPVSLFRESPLSPEDFEVPEPGTSQTFDLTFTFQFKLLNGEDADNAEEIVSSNVAEGTGEITIHHQEDSNGGGDDNGDPQGSATTEGVEVSILIND